MDEPGPPSLGQPLHLGQDPGRQSLMFGERPRAGMRTPGDPSSLPQLAILNSESDVWLLVHISYLVSTHLPRPPGACTIRDHMNEPAREGGGSLLMKGESTH